MLILDETVKPRENDLMVAGGGDDRFAIGIAVTFFSLLVNLPADTRVFVYVLDGGIEQPTKERLHRMLEVLPLELHIRYLTVDVSRYAGLRTPKHLTVMTYLRLALPELLPDLPKVFYIDTDLVIHRNVLELWEIPIGEYPSIAVRELGFATVEHGLPQTYQKLGISKDTPYCNAGVMVMNLERWRQEGLQKRILDYSVEYADTNQCGDQDGINAMLAGNWLSVNPRWNVQVGSVLNIKHLPDTVYRREVAGEVSNWISDPYILHFVGKKPWQGGLFNPARPLFVHYLERSGWLGRDALAQWKRDWLKKSLGDLSKGFGEKVRARI